MSYFIGNDAFVEVIESFVNNYLFNPGTENEKENIKFAERFKQIMEFHFWEFMINRNIRISCDDDPLALLFLKLGDQKRKIYKLKQRIEETRKERKKEQQTGKKEKT